MKINELNKLNGYVIITEYFNQYAWGITGVNRVNTIITNEGTPFEFKKDAVAYAKANNIKNERKKGEPNEGYGSVGAMEFKVSFVKASSLSKREMYYIIR